MKQHMNSVDYPPATVLRRLAPCAGALIVSLLAMTPILATSAGKLIGRPAPEFALRTLDDRNIRLSEYLGDVVLVNFWATWSGACRQEMPLLDELYGKYRRAGLVLLSINVDDEPERAAEMAQTLNVSYPVLFDQRKDVSRAYQLGTMPVTILIDREGVVRYVSEGYKPGYEKRYAERLRELLNE